MRLGCGLLVLGIFLIGAGGQGLYEASKFRKQVVMEHNQFVQARPGEGWFRLNNCILDLTKAVYEMPRFSTSKRVEKAWLPVHGMQEARGSKASLVLQTNDPQILGTLQEMVGMEDQSEAVLKKWMMQNVDRILLKKSLQGMVQFGMDSNSKTRDRISNLSEEITPDYLVLEEGKTPSAGGAAGKMALGALAGVGGLFILGFRPGGRNE